MMHDDPEARALLRRILEVPADDVARLVFADWLQEHDEPERAEFIRVQGRIAHLDMGARMLPKGVGRELLFAAEGNLVRNHWDDWVPLNLTGEYLFAWDEATATIELGCSHSFYAFNRGFVSEVRLSLAAFMEHAEALFRAHPIERVTLTDREPLWAPEAGRAAWVSDEANLHAANAACRVGPLARWLPVTAGYENLLRVYETRELARAALSAACVAYGYAGFGMTSFSSARITSSAGVGVSATTFAAS
jgi:uncharacterized protein (TIGR02996 family)